MNYQEFLNECKKRRQEIYADHLAGMSYTQIGQKYNITFTRVAKILKKEKLQAQKMPSYFILP